MLPLGFSCEMCRGRDSLGTCHSGAVSEASSPWFFGLCRERAGLETRVQALSAHSGTTASCRCFGLCGPESCSGMYRRGRFVVVKTSNVL